MLSGRLTPLNRLLHGWFSLCALELLPDQLPLGTMWSSRSAPILLSLPQTATLRQPEIPPVLPESPLHPKHQAAPKSYSSCTAVHVPAEVCYLKWWQRYRTRWFRLPQPSWAPRFHAQLPFQPKELRCFGSPCSLWYVHLTTQDADTQLGIFTVSTWWKKRGRHL